MIALRAVPLASSADRGHVPVSLRGGRGAGRRTARRGPRVHSRGTYAASTVQVVGQATSGAVYMVNMPRHCVRF